MLAAVSRIEFRRSNRQTLCHHLGPLYRLTITARRALLAKIDANIDAKELATMKEKIDRGIDKMELNIESTIKKMDDNCFQLVLAIAEMAGRLTQISVLEYR